MKTILNHIKPQNSQATPETGSAETGRFVKQDISFTINTLGFFKYISPTLLEFLDEMDNLFFESVLFEKSGKNDLPSPVEYLTEMINPERDSVFVKEVLKNEASIISGAYWNIIAEGNILKFTLSDAPPITETGERRAG